MHIETDFWNFFFGITVFLLFVYQLIDIARAYLIPYLLECLQRKDHEQTEFFEREELLFSARKKIEKKIEDQNKMFAQLENNMLSVCEYQAKKLEQAAADKELFKQKAHLRLTQQMVYREQRQALRKVLPDVFLQAEDKLRAFLQKNDSAHFLHALKNNKMYK